jgi:hypothetical protein
MADNAEKDQVEYCFKPTFTVVARVDRATGNIRSRLMPNRPKPASPADPAKE